MSKERDLLKRWLSEFGRICCNKNLLIETKELLAQPVTDSNYRSVGKALYLAPLYPSPPKREPLSLEELCKLYGDNVVEDIFTFARAIEKAHGIREEWIDE